MRRWYKPVPLSRLNIRSVPDVSGVYVLLRDENDISSVLKIGPARSLRRTFERELEPAGERLAETPTAMMFCEARADAEEADRLIAEYRRRHGKKPVLNSPY
jgi:excinuclease UvrABC nuclease subunit